jgi:hypothetical protein
MKKIVITGSGKSLFKGGTGSYLGFSTVFPTGIYHAISCSTDRKPVISLVHVDTGGSFNLTARHFCYNAMSSQDYVALLAKLFNGTIEELKGVDNPQMSEGVEILIVCRTNSDGESQATFYDPTSALATKVMSQSAA